MPVYETPQPISVTVDLGVANVHIAASERTDTLVEIRPSNPSDSSDVTAAEQTRVEYADGALRVTAPRIRALDFSRSSRSIEVSIELPSGSQVAADVQLGDVRSTGVLGECRIKTGARHVQLGDTGSLRVETGAGDIAIGRVVGDAEVKTGSGKVTVDGVDGGATIKNSNGRTEIGTITGQLRVRSANGDITVARVGAGVDVKTSCGTIRVGEVVSGSIDLKSGYGELEVGIAEGTAAWLDVHTGFGRLRNALDEVTAAQPPSGAKAEIHARTSFGDITIRRAERQLS